MLNLAVVAMVVVAVVGAVSTYTEKFLTTKVGQEVMCDLRRAVYHHIQRLSLSFYDRSRVGDLISRVTVDIDAIQDFVSSALLGMVVDALKLAGMVALMFYLNWHFTLIALLVAPVLFVEVYSLKTSVIQLNAMGSHRPEEQHQQACHDDYAVCGQDPDQ